MPIIEPDFRVNAATAGDHATNRDNWNAALSIYATGATGAILLLPKARVYSLQPDINDAHRGLVIQGSGTETKLINRTTTPVPGYVLRVDTQNFGYLEYPGYAIGGSQLEFNSQAPGANYRLNDVVWMFQPNAAGSNVRTTIQQRYTITAKGTKTVTLSAPIGTAGLAAKWTKGGRIVTATGLTPDNRFSTVTVSPATAAADFKADTWCFLADGAAVNTIYGEFVRVTANDPATGVVTLDDYIRRTGYHPGAAGTPGALTALIPGPFPEDFAIRDLVIGGEGGAGAAGLFLIGCVGLTLENVQFELGDPAAVAGTAFSLANCRKVTLINCRIPYGTGFNNVQNLVVYGGEITNFECEEFCQEIEIHGTRLSGDFTIFETCADVKVFGGSLTLQYGTIRCDSFRLCGSKVSAVAFGITGASPSLVDIQWDSPNGCHLNPGCTNGFISGIRFVPGGFLNLLAGSSGYYDGVTGGFGVVGEGAAYWTTPPRVQSGIAGIDRPLVVASSATGWQNATGLGTRYPTAAAHLKALAPTRPVQALETACPTDNPILRTYQDRVTTTGATATALRTIPLADNFHYVIEATVLAHRTGGTAGATGASAYFARAVRAKRVSGGTASLGVVQEPVTDKDDATWNCTLVGSGNNVVVQVTGQANENITWLLLKCQLGSWREATTNEYQDKLVAYWKLDEEAGATRVDSVLGRNLMHFGSVTPVGQVFGRYRSFAAQFNKDPANPNYLSYSPFPSTDLQLDNDTDWYWCGWVLCTGPMPSDKPNYVVLAKRDGSDLEYQFHVSRTSDAVGDLKGHLGPQSAMVTVTKPGFTADAWHFVEFWHDATSHTLFIDFDRSGSPGTASTLSAGLKGTRPLNVGLDDLPVPNYHRGLVDDLGLYSYIPPDAIRDGLFGGITPY
jgi:hypothetical protein